MRQETRLSDGTVTGRYGYTDPFGVFRVVKYVSGSNGYYATEEIGEQVTSSTPQYYKATAAQVDSVSEQPLSYTHELATKFNPPLYHPEAHTMEYTERDEYPTTNAPDFDNRQIYATNPDTRSHQIFSLSNSEDILENKYRERKQLEKSLRDLQNQKQLNFLAKQTIDKRFGEISTTDYKINKPFNSQSNDKLRKISDYPIEDNINYSNNNNNNPSVNTENEETFRRVPIIDDKKNKTNFKIFSFNEKTNKNESEINNFTENPINVENRPKDVTTGATEDYSRGTTEKIPENLRHLYYNPTRTPVFSYSTSVSREIHEISSESQNKTQTNNDNNRQKDIWDKIRERFIFGSPTTTQSNTIISTDGTTPSTDNPFITTTTDSSVPEFENKTEVLSPIFFRESAEEFESIPEDIVEEEEPKYVDRNYFFESNKNYITIKNQTLSQPIDITTESHNTTENQLFESFTDFSLDNNTTEKYDLLKNKDNISEQTVKYFEDLEIITSVAYTESTTQTPITESTQEFITESTTTTNNNSSADQTKSAFFHQIWSNFDKSDGNERKTDENLTDLVGITTSTETPAPTTSQTLSETLVYSLQNNSNTNSEEFKVKTQENSTNSQFIHDFWHNLNEKTIMFSEAKVENMTFPPILSPSTLEKQLFGSENIENITDIKHIMYSEGKVENQTFIPELSPNTEQTTDINTESNEQLMTTTTTSTESINSKYLNNFWHKFNDNSDDYFLPVLQNTTYIETDVKKDITSTETTTSQELLKENSTENQNSLKTNENKDLETLENTNYSTRIQTNLNPNLPALQSDQNQYIPPLSALFGFPHMRKRVRRVQRLRLRQPVLDIQTEEQITTTTAPVDSDLDNGSEALSVEESTQLKTISSDRVYQYIPPYPVFRQSVSEKGFESNKGISKPEEYSEEFDDISEIMKTIQTMRKPIEGQNEESDKELVRFDDKIEINTENRDNIGFIQNESESHGLDLIRKRYAIDSQNNNHFKPQPKYLFPLEPRIDDKPEVKESHEFIQIDRNNHRYEPPIRVSAEYN